LPDARARRWREGAADETGAAVTSATTTAGLDLESLEFTIESISEFARRELPDALLVELDERDEFPEALVRRMCSEELGVQLLFVPEEYGGMGGSAFDVYRVCELMAQVDLGLATSVLATFLGSDPIVVGGTPEQRALWLGRIAEDGILMAYGATEPDAGSDLPALKTTATPIAEDGAVVAYALNGAKQWISNGGVAEAATVLALAPGGPSWFVVDSDAPGFTHGDPEDKHGIRLSNTAALFFDDVRVPADRLVGAVEGQGLVQAQQVFGYTRLMVAAFGLGAGWAALDRAIPYSTERVQAGGPLSEKQGYTHKLIVPHAVRLEAARAAIEETAARIDAGEGALNTEGAIAKYLASEAGHAAADAAIQALGGYGYTHEYLVEKITRDVRITTIYEGTSEIMEMTVARDRWQQHLKTRGEYYHSQALALEALHIQHPGVGADVAALAHHALADAMEGCRTTRMTRHQHVLLRLGSLVAQVEGAGALARRAAAAATGTLPEKSSHRHQAPALAAMSRANARDVALAVGTDAVRWLAGTPAVDAVSSQLPAIHAAQAGLIGDLDAVSNGLYGRTPTPGMS
jgi:alkylation response protein AidB-like acyl-CoA dehydrogenase